MTQDPSVLLSRQNTKKDPKSNRTNDQKTNFFPFKESFSHNSHFIPLKICLVTKSPSEFLHKRNEKDFELLSFLLHMRCFPQ